MKKLFIILAIATFAVSCTCNSKQGTCNDSTIIVKDTVEVDTTVAPIGSLLLDSLIVAE